MLDLGGRRWDAVVVVDESPLTGEWRPVIDDFVAWLRRQAAFGDVDVRRLVDVTRTPTGPRMVFLVTDGWSPAWRTGAAQRALATWAVGTLVTVVHLMPQETWRQSVDTVEVTWRPSGPAVTTAGLAWTEHGLGLRTAGPDTVAVPVVETGEGWLRRWARLVTGAGPVTMPALVTSPAHRPPVPRPVTPADLVADFRASRTRTAFALAVSLAAAPLTVETIGAIRRSVPRAVPSHLVEVLSSDLVRPVVATGSGAIRFEFVEGVRERLLSFGHRDRTIAVQHLVEDVLAVRVPAVRGLVGRVRDPRRDRSYAVDAADVPYRRVELAVHRALWCGR